MLSVIIPALNEEGAIAETIDTIARTLAEANITHEIIVVDDGSRDRTGAVARERGVRVVPRMASPFTFHQSPMPCRMAMSFGSISPLPIGPTFSNTLPPRAADLASSWMKCAGGLCDVSNLLQP